MFTDPAEEVIAPAGASMQASSVTLPEVGLNFPAGQGVQNAEPEPDEKVPALQATHELRLCAPTLTLKVPGGHEIQAEKAN
jgi:hypothetical protein